MSVAEMLARLHIMCVYALCNGMFNVRIEVHADCHKHAPPWMVTPRSDLQ